MMEINKIYEGNCLDVLKTFEDNSIDCCVTSPPFWGLRDYGIAGQFGVEETPEAYVNKLADLFDEVKRCLKNEGTLWLNLGDSYISAKLDYMSTQTLKKGNKSDYIQKDSGIGYPPNRRNQLGYKTKDLVGIPWLVAFELRKRGWWLRCDIVWNKPNPMPESVKDRPTRSHEFIFLLSKSVNYYYDYEAIKTPSQNPNIDYSKTHLVGNKRNPTDKINGFRPRDNPAIYEMANKRDVWTVTTQACEEAHFATFPQDLIVDCILAGCPYGGIVLDPFFGSGTTGIVAKKKNRNFIGIEINHKYIKIANKRLYKEIGMFL